MIGDRRLVYAAALARALATGLIGVSLGLYLDRLRLGPAAVGAVVAAGLAGGALATLLVTLAAGRIGRRRALVAITALSAAGAVAMLFVRGVGPLAIAAFLGMVNGMGRDRGAALVLEQALLPSTVDAAARTRAFAVYNVLQDVGHALGGLAAGLPAALEGLGTPGLTAARSTIALYAALSLAPLLLYARLSPAVDAPPAARLAVSRASRRLLARISALFAIDSLGGGFLTTALIAYFFHLRFGVGAAAVGPLFFAARLANAASHFGAAWLARKIGLVRTMVFTHIPSSLLLVAVAFAPTFPLAALLFLLREGLVEMDVPTRQSYVMAVVAPEERDVASGVTHLVRLGGWAVAPGLAGLLMSHAALLVPLIVGAAIKIAYDVLLYAAFRRVRPPEER